MESFKTSHWYGQNGQSGYLLRLWLMKCNVAVGSPGSSLWNGVYHKACLLRRTLRTNTFGRKRKREAGRGRAWTSLQGAIDLEQSVLQRVPSWAETFMPLHSSVTGWYWKAGHQDQTQHLGNTCFFRRIWGVGTAYAPTGDFNSLPFVCLCGLWLIHITCAARGKATRRKEVINPQLHQGQRQVCLLH